MLRMLRAAAAQPRRRLVQHPGRQRERGAELAGGAVGRKGGGRRPCARQGRTGQGMEGGAGGRGGRRGGRPRRAAGLRPLAASRCGAVLPTPVLLQIFIIDSSGAGPDLPLCPQRPAPPLLPPPSRFRVCQPECPCKRLLQGAFQDLQSCVSREAGRSGPCCSTSGGKPSQQMFANDCTDRKLVF